MKIVLSMLLVLIIMRLKEPCGNEEEKGKQVLLNVIDNIKKYAEKFVMLFSFWMSY